MSIAGAAARAGRGANSALPASRPSRAMGTNGDFKTFPPSDRNIRPGLGPGDVPAHDSAGEATHGTPPGQLYAATLAKLWQHWHISSRSHEKFCQRSAAARW